MTGTAASLRLTGSGFAQLPTVAVDLQAPAAGTWVDTGLAVALPGAGTYQLDATVRTAIAASSPSNTWIVVRLWDVQAAAVVPGSEVIVQQVNLSSSSGVVNVGDNSTAPVQVEYSVPAGRTVRLEARRTGASTTANVHSNVDGRTTLRFNRVA